MASEERERIYRKETSQIPSSMMHSKDELTKTSELRVMLIGRTGDDKTEVMNVLLRNSDEIKNPSAHKDQVSLSNNEKCLNENLIIGEQKIMVVDTPGLCDAEKKDKEVMKEIKKCLSQVDPGPHAFLFVLPLDRFTQELQNMVKIFKSSFSDYVLQYTMVVFVDKEKLEDGQTIEDFIRGSKELKKFVKDDCKKRYHLVRQTDGQPEVKELVQEIQNMVKANKEKYYTAEEAWERRIRALVINGSALAGAAVGGLTAHLVSGSVSVLAGLAIGAVVGGVAGLVGCIVAARVKKAGCVLQ